MDGPSDEFGFRTYIERSPVAVFVADGAGDYVDVNAAACDLLGYDREQLCSLSVGELAVQTDGGDPAESFETLKATGRVQTETTLRHADGHTVDVLLNAVEWSRNRYLAYCQDISERKEFERRLAESEARYRSMANALDTSGVGTFILDADFSVVWINEAVEEFFGVAREDLTGRDKATAIESEIKHIFERPDRFAETVLASYADNSYVSSFRCHVLPEGDREERWLLHWSAPIGRGLYEGGRIEHYTDVTAAVTYERSLEEQRDGLRVLNEVLRHDVRNALQLVVANADLLADHVDADERQHVDRIRESAQEVVEFTRTARETAEMLLTADGDHEPVDPRPVLDDVLTEVRTANPSATIADETTLPAATVRADHLLESVLRNVLSNAIQHSDTAEPTVTVTGSVDDESVTFRIADDGPGVTDDRKDEIFRRGETGDESRGSGLGLSLVRTLVEGYGGDVWVEDNDPTGAVFVVELPRAD